MARRNATDSPRYGYKVSMQLDEHHIVGKKKLLCEPDRYPEKSPNHTQNIDFDKSPRRTFFNDETISTFKDNTSRCLPVELPKICSKTRYVGKILMSKQLSRKDVFVASKVPSHYMPDAEKIKCQTTYCIFEY